jgi:ABC-type lipoprotein release transport system permease subunit
MPSATTGWRAVAHRSEDRAAIGRIVDTEREQIGLLKAFGYTDLAVAWHYVKLVLGIAALGTVLGSAAGMWLGRALTELYTEFFRFPFLYYRPSHIPAAEPSTVPSATMPSTILT